VPGLDYASSAALWAAAGDGVSALHQGRSARELLEFNQRFYDTFWSGVRLIEAPRFNTWPLVASLLPQAPARLEIAPGLRPRLPIEGTQFIDISTPALTRLRRRGAQVACGSISDLPYGDRLFDLVCALDIIEHVDDDVSAWREIARVTKPGAVLLVSVPLHPARWNAFDDFVGHRRRYRPEELRARLAEHGFLVEQCAVFGMQPKSSRLLELGMWWLTHHRERAMWWYNLFLPVGVFFQGKLQLTTNLEQTENADEILLVCRKTERT
jgi:SAM-dependent methyltransferase